VSTPFARVLGSAGVSFAAALSLPLELARVAVAGFSRGCVATGAGLTWRTGALRRETLGCDDAFHGKSNKKASALEEKPASTAKLAVIASKAFR
jgi:hypothetical protein